MLIQNLGLIDQNMVLAQNTVLERDCIFFALHYKNNWILVTGDLNLIPYSKYYVALEQGGKRYFMSISTKMNEGIVVDIARRMIGTDIYYQKLNALKEDVEFFTLYMKRNKKSDFL